MTNLGLSLLLVYCIWERRFQGFSNVIRKGTKARFGDDDSPYSIEEYLEKAKEILIERPELYELGRLMLRRGANFHMYSEKKSKKISFLIRYGQKAFWICWIFSVR